MTYSVETFKKSNDFPDVPLVCDDDSAIADAQGSDGSRRSRRRCLDNATQPQGRFVAPVPGQAVPSTSYFVPSPNYLGTGTPPEPAALLHQGEQQETARRGPSVVTVWSQCGTS